MAITIGSMVAKTESFDEAREGIHRQMLSAVSHDLKTPLATIIGSLEIYERMAGKLTEDKKTALLNAALSEAYRLDNFITNILDMAKLESGMVKPRLESCDLGAVLRDCLMHLGPKTRLGDIRILTAGKPVLASTDPILLGRAAKLVLENAIKHGGRPPVIHIEYGEEGRRAHISIRDHGPGIPSGREKEIFSKYTRFARTDQQNAGTGLGLAICQQLMWLLEGSVGVANHPDGGAVFTLHFPKN